MSTLLLQSTAFQNKMPAPNSRQNSPSFPGTGQEAFSRQSETNASDAVVPQCDSERRRINPAILALLPDWPRRLPPIPVFRDDELAQEDPLLGAARYSVQEAQRF